MLALYHIHMLLHKSSLEMSVKGLIRGARFHLYWEHFCLSLRTLLIRFLLYHYSLSQRGPFGLIWTQISSPFSLVTLELLITFFSGARLHASRPSLVTFIRLHNALKL